MSIGQNFMTRSPKFGVFLDKFKSRIFLPASASWILSDWSENAEHYSYHIPFAVVLHAASRAVQRFLTALSTLLFDGVASCLRKFFAPFPMYTDKQEQCINTGTKKRTNKATTHWSCLVPSFVLFKNFSTEPVLLNSCSHPDNLLLVAVFWEGSPFLAWAVVGALFPEPPSYFASSL